MDKHVILGYSGHAFVVIDAAQQAGLNIIAYTEKAEKTLNPFGLEYFGFEEDENFKGWEKEFEFIIGIGDNIIRQKVTELINTRNEKLRSVIHPSANIGSHIEFGDGTFVGPGVLINPLVKIGKAVIINTGAIVEHESQIGDYTHIAPGAVLAGNVKVGARSFIGANAIVKEGIEIGCDVIVGAGTVVLNNIQSECKVVGNPGRLI